MHFVNIVFSECIGYAFQLTSVVFLEIILLNVSFIIVYIHPRMNSYTNLFIFNQNRLFKGYQGMNHISILIHKIVLKSF